jgi:hypothetical protein
VAWASLSRIEGLSEFIVQTLYNHGFRAAQDVIDADDEFLASIPGFSADAVPRVKASAREVVKAELAEKNQLRVTARHDARVLLAVERAAHEQRLAGKTDESRLEQLEGVQGYVLERLKEANFMAPEDLYFEEDIDRLVNIAGFSPGKARQLKVSAASAVHAMTKGAAPNKEKPLSEPEARDAQQYDELHTHAAHGTTEEVA